MRLRDSWRGILLCTALCCGWLACSLVYYYPSTENTGDDDIVTRERVTLVDDFDDLANTDPISTDTTWVEEAGSEIEPVVVTSTGTTGRCLYINDTEIANNTEITKTLPFAAVVGDTIAMKLKPVTTTDDNVADGCVYLRLREDADTRVYIRWSTVDGGLDVYHTAAWNDSGLSLTLDAWNMVEVTLTSTTTTTFRVNGVATSAITNNGTISASIDKMQVDTPATNTDQIAEDFESYDEDHRVRDETNPFGGVWDAWVVAASCDFTAVTASGQKWGHLVDTNNDDRIFPNMAFPSSHVFVSGSWFEYTINVISTTSVNYPVVTIQTTAGSANVVMYHTATAIKTLSNAAVTDVFTGITFPQTIRITYAGASTFNVYRLVDGAWVAATGNPFTNVSGATWASRTTEKLVVVSSAAGVGGGQSESYIGNIRCSWLTTVGNAVPVITSIDDIYLHEPGDGHMHFYMNELTEIGTPTVVMDLTWAPFHQADGSILCVDTSSTSVFRLTGSDFETVGDPIWDEGEGAVAALMVAPIDDGEWFAFFGYTDAGVAQFFYSDDYGATTAARGTIADGNCIRDIFTDGTDVWVIADDEGAVGVITVYKWNSGTSAWDVVDTDTDASYVTGFTGMGCWNLAGTVYYFLAEVSDPGTDVLAFTPGTGLITAQKRSVTAYKVSRTTAVTNIVCTKWASNLAYPRLYWAAEAGENRYLCTYTFIPGGFESFSTFADRGPVNAPDAYKLTGHAQYMIDYQYGDIWASTRGMIFGMTINITDTDFDGIMSCTPGSVEDPTDPPYFFDPDAGEGKTHVYSWLDAHEKIKKCTVFSSICAGADLIAECDFMMLTTDAATVRNNTFVIFHDQFKNVAFYGIVVKRTEYSSLTMLHAESRISNRPSQSVATTTATNTAEKLVELLRGSTFSLAGSVTVDTGSAFTTDYAYHSVATYDCTFDTLVHMVRAMERAVAWITPIMDFYCEPHDNLTATGLRVNERSRWQLPVTTGYFEDAVAVSRVLVTYDGGTYTYTGTTNPEALSGMRAPPLFTDLGIEEEAAATQIATNLHAIFSTTTRFITMSCAGMGWLQPGHTISFSWDRGGISITKADYMITSVQYDVKRDVHVAIQLSNNIVTREEFRKLELNET